MVNARLAERAREPAVDPDLDSLSLQNRKATIAGWEDLGIDDQHDLGRRLIDINRGYLERLDRRYCLCQSIDRALKSIANVVRGTHVSARAAAARGARGRRSSRDAGSNLRLRG